MVRNKICLYVSVLTISFISLLIFVTSLGPCPVTTPMTLLVTRGITTSSISNQLKQYGIIRSELLFKAIAQVCRLKPIRGEYVFNSRSNIFTIIFKLKYGKINFTLVNIPPGSNAWGIQQRFKDFIPQDQFWFLWRNRRFTSIAGFPNAVNMEGLIGPFVYKVNHAQEPEEIFVNFAETFRNRIMPKLNGGTFTPYETLILASLIEKETSIPKEMSLIAGVYVKRLQLKMKLQCDPTLLYARWHSGIRQFGAPTISDINRIDCFNTYKTYGLPPTPIASPGWQAILAAKSPLVGPNLYFSATGDGNHTFATNLAAHNRNVYNYRQKVSKRGF